MPRQPRIKAPNQIYSVVTRVNNSQTYFMNDTLSCALLDHIREAKKKLKFKLYGFVIMHTHVHLLIQPDDNVADISAVMKHINGYFAVKFNRFNKIKGHFWMERFKSKIVQDFKYLVNTIIYFALNPVRAGVVDNPLEFRFSSINNIKDSNIFSDILDPMPEEFQQIIKDFLEREKFLNYVAMVAKKAIMKLKYSFNLRKTKREQIYKNFVGSYAFARKNILSNKN